MTRSGLRLDTVSAAPPGPRASRDRLEVLTALLAAPSFDPVFARPVIVIPGDHPAYRWQCAVTGCERASLGNADLCSAHRLAWLQARVDGRTRREFIAGAEPLGEPSSPDARCMICPDRPAPRRTRERLCQRHHSSWTARQRRDDTVGFAQWVADQHPFPGYGYCHVAACPTLADSPLGLCVSHRQRYHHAGAPGRAALPQGWWRTFEARDRPVPVGYHDRGAFQAWCASAPPIPRAGQINLLGVRPLLRAEIQWALATHAASARPARWDLQRIQRLVGLLRARDATSLVDLDHDELHRFDISIVAKMKQYLRQVYFAPSQARQAGFLDTEHYGVRFPHRGSHVDLSAIPQDWLRTLLWDYLAELLRSPQRCPRTAAPIDGARRALTELGTFLSLDAPEGGADPTALTVEHMHRFVADQRRRARDGTASLAMTTSDGTPSRVTENTARVTFSGVRRVLRDALDTGRADQLGLDRAFIVAMPAPGPTRTRPRHPFSDEAAKALADDTNLARLAESYDPDDLGMRDAWETIVTTGRRVNEVLRLRWNCLGRYGGLAMLWHDQTKVGNYDAAIRIPERLYTILAERQRKTVERYGARYGHRPNARQRAELALFPTPSRNPDGAAALGYQWFHTRFRQWIADLDLGPLVPHQARHTLATNLLRAGASLTHIRRYLGQVSDRMAEHYVHLAQSDLEDVLQHVWVAGPGTADPGRPLTGESATTLTREQAQALALDLTRRSTPAEGGFCTFQPVVDGGACPWNLDCHNCDKFVLSGADLLYWRRKREQWRLLAEGAPDDVTADYLQRYFEPTARAINGLEAALAGLGLLDDALALDLRKPQDYFHRVWSTAFRAADLTDHKADHDQRPGEACA